MGATEDEGRRRFAAGRAGRTFGGDHKSDRTQADTGDVTARVALLCALVLAAAPLAAASAERAPRCTKRGTPRADVIFGTRGRDVLCGLGGRDVLIDFGGNDVLLGGAGDDTLSGGPGNDRLEGGPGNDRLEGAHGRDTLLGGPGDDRLFAYDGAPDVVNGGPGVDDATADRTVDRVTGVER